LFCIFWIIIIVFASFLSSFRHNYKYVPSNPEWLVIFYTNPRRMSWPRIPQDIAAYDLQWLAEALLFFKSWQRIICWSCLFYKLHGWRYVRVASLAQEIFHAFELPSVMIYDIVLDEKLANTFTAINETYVRTSGARLFMQDYSRDWTPTNPKIGCLPTRRLDLLISSGKFDSYWRSFFISTFAFSIVIIHFICSW